MYGVVTNHGLDINDGLPVFGAEEDDGDIGVCLAGFDHSKDFEDFVESTEAPWHNNDRADEVEEPEFTEEEVIEVEFEFWGDVVVSALFFWNINS